jgi:hypothetical protein
VQGLVEAPWCRAVVQGDGQRVFPLGDDIQCSGQWSVVGAQSSVIRKSQSEHWPLNTEHWVLSLAAFSGHL